MTLKHRPLRIAALAFVLGVAAGSGPGYLIATSEAMLPASTGITVVNDGAFSGTTAPLYPVTFEAKNLPNGTEWTATVGATVASGSGPDLILLMPNGTYDWNVTPPLGDYALFTVASGVPPDAFYEGGAGAGEYGNLTIQGSALTVSVTFASHPTLQMPPPAFVHDPLSVFLLFAIVGLTVVLPVAMLLLRHRKRPGT